MVAAKTSPKPRPKAEDSAPSVSMTEGFAPSNSMAEGYARFEANLHKQFVWGLRYIDAPVLRDRETDGGEAGLDERLYYTQDGNFNVTALVNPAGDVVERYSYDAYGQVTVRNGAENVDPDTVNDPATQWDDDPDNASDVDNRLLYCGYRFDSETGLYHVRHRYHHPTLGRWTTRDPLGYVDGMGLYEYCVSSPMGLVDHLGCKSDSEYLAKVQRARRNMVQTARRSAKDRKGLLTARKKALDTIAEGNREFGPIGPMTYLTAATPEWLTKKAQRAQEYIDAYLLLAGIEIELNALRAKVRASETKHQDLCVNGWKQGKLPDRKAKKGFKPDTNGCGPTGLAWAVPDKIPGVYDFTEACKGHDIAYQTCGKSKKAGDTEFYRDMLKHCNKSKDKDRCEQAAAIYWFAVSKTKKAEAAYWDGQYSACECGCE